MDIDTSFSFDGPPALPTSVSSPPVAKKEQLSHLFYDTASPATTAPSLSLNDLSPAPPTPGNPFDAASSSPGCLLSSPSERSLNNRRTVTKPFLPADLSGQRPRRPTFSRQQPDSSSIHSAFPTLEHAETFNLDKLLPGPPPTRRAFSANLYNAFSAQLSPDSSFEEPSGSSPAQAYAQRQKRRGVSDCLKPAAVISLHESPTRPSPTVRPAPSSPGLQAFGANERSGKILPCRSVPQDGLMRVTPQTVHDLLQGNFDDRIHDYHVIDCRFDYEYEGGHIPGAVNINTPSAVEQMLLTGLTKPKPSVSGDAYRKTILVFHCEFSMKRAPTFAKHLRAKDRSLNNSVYPKIHYPEVYILDGGYCGYFKVFGERCSPPAYVTMDDPQHSASRREDLDQFRKNKLGRTKSYAYGDAIIRPPSQPTGSKRSTMPANNGSIFTSGNAARARRAGSASLRTLNEDHSLSVDEETDADIGDSPCPPPTKHAGGRMPMTRAETYGPSRMPLCY
ncbi:Rhodanese-like protein [Cylindrobasidium torrendii FP15055 ss-10]|uniref:M-phase inducer phosphatase n=1 Tax=Cylindrobasidium torrendii FP15055 ss-10 TaxID=1314674 RepID=A0A0D7BLW1_9AGAR|nr:Rhodanese-like protein [Cylindrobasidium torrendii FP15055 ss-10]